MQSRLLLICSAVLSACAWEPPVEQYDTGAHQGVIMGEVVVVGPEVPADVYVLIYDAANPGPPDGLGSPLNFDVIPKEMFEDDGLGSWSAPYGLTALPPGEFLISALHDTDDDFSPVVDIGGGSTCGDWGGGYVGVVELEDGSTTFDTIPISLDDGELLHGVPVAIQIPIPVEKPSFTILGGDGQPATGAVGLSRDGVLQLAATAVGTEYLELYPLQNVDAKTDCGVAFPFVPQVTYDDTGAPVVEGFEPPLVYLTQMLDDAAQARGDVPIVIEGIVEYDYLSLLGQLLVDSSRPAETLGLSVRFSLDGQYFLPFSTSTTGDGDINSLPAGPWAVTVVNAAGQTWTVPNEFGASEANPFHGFQPATQVAMVTFQ